MFALWLVVVAVSFFGVFFFDENIFYLFLFSVLFLPDVFSSRFLSYRVSLHSYVAWLKSGLNWLVSFFYCDTTLYRSYTSQLLLPFSQKLGLAQRWMARLVQFYSMLCSFNKAKLDLLISHGRYFEIFNLVFFARFKAPTKRTQVFATQLKQFASTAPKIKVKSLVCAKTKGKPKAKKTAVGRVGKRK
jgi:uncharacterized membrane protein